MTSSRKSLQGELEKKSGRKCQSDQKWDIIQQRGQEIEDLDMEIHTQGPLENWEACKKTIRSRM